MLRTYCWRGRWAGEKKLRCVLRSALQEFDCSVSCSQKACCWQSREERWACFSPAGLLILLLGCCRMLARCGHLMSEQTYALCVLPLAFRCLLVCFSESPRPSGQRV